MLSKEKALPAIAVWDASWHALHDGKIRVDSLREICHFSWNKDAIMITSHMSVRFEKDVTCRRDTVWNKPDVPSGKNILRQLFSHLLSSSSVWESNYHSSHVCHFVFPPNKNNYQSFVCQMIGKLLNSPSLSSPSVGDASSSEANIQFLLAFCKLTSAFIWVLKSADKGNNATNFLFPFQRCFYWILTFELANKY